MFKKFIPDQDIRGRNIVKSSIQRTIRSNIASLYPNMEPFLDEIFPKKANILQLKLPERISIYKLEGEKEIGLFFNSHDDDFIPTLRLLYELQQVQPETSMIKCISVDEGAIKHIISGADCMRPGIEDIGEESFEVGEILGIKSAGRQGLIAIGRALMSHEQMKQTNKGEAVQILHSIGDGLWMYDFAE